MPPKGPGVLVLILAMASSLFVVMLFSTILFGTGKQEEKEYTQFLQDLKDDKVESVLVIMRNRS